jgi:aryl-alcohol dehydrogenase-like predicted oxidoreductase
MANLSTNQAATTLDLGGDLTVRRLGFGAMRITGPGIWGEPADHDDAIATLRRAVELGVNFVDTADSYGPFVSERLIAEALHPYPEDLVIATKGGMTGLDRGIRAWTAGPSTCARLATRACSACASSRFRCTSSIARIRTCRSRTRSACSPS